MSRDKLKPMDLIDHIKKLMNNADVADHDKQENGQYTTDGHMHKSVALAYVDQLIAKATTPETKHFLEAMRNAAATLKKDEMESPANYCGMMQGLVTSELKKALNKSQEGQTLLSWKNIEAIDFDLQALEKLPIPDLSASKKNLLAKQ